MQKIVSIDRFGLKMFAIICMLLDHTFLFFNMAPLWFHFIGRLAAPVFFYLMVEGFFKTGNRRRYLLRLYGFAAFMETGNYILNRLIPNQTPLKYNIFFSLALCLTLLVLINTIANREHKTGIILLITVILAVELFCSEAGIIGLYLTFIFYIYYNRKETMCKFYFVFTLLYHLSLNLISAVTFGEFTLHALFFSNPQWMMCFAAVLFYFYNHRLKRGGQASKYFFYVFYPVHMWVLYIISSFIGK